MQVMHDIARLPIGTHHKDRSTLRGQCHFLAFETGTHQPVALLDQDDADLRITHLPYEPSATRVHRGAEVLNGPDDPQLFA